MKYKLLTVLLSIALLPGPTSATMPEIIQNCRDERPQADRDPTNIEANYHTEFILGYLSAVLDSLREDKPVCIYEVDGAMFCSAFKSYIIKYGAPGRNSFGYSKKAISESYDCKNGDNY